MQENKKMRAKEGNLFKSSFFGAGVVVSAKHISSAPKGESSSTMELQIGGVAAPELVWWSRSPPKHAQRSCPPKELSFINPKRSSPPKELINKHRVPHSFFISEKCFLCQGCNINCEVLLFTLFCENLDWSLAINTITIYYTGPTSVLGWGALSWLGSTKGWTR
jgi:hypothetical protein